MVDVLPNLPLGVETDFVFKAQHTQLAYDDVLFLYTDGVAEANKGDNELFGLDRTRDALNSAKATDPESIIRCVSDAVKDHLGDSEPFDDVTMLCVMYMGSGDLR